MISKHASTLGWQKREVLYGFLKYKLEHQYWVCVPESLTRSCNLIHWFSPVGYSIIYKYDILSDDVAYKHTNQQNKRHIKLKYKNVRKKHTDFHLVFFIMKAPVKFYSDTKASLWQRQHS